MRNYKKLFGQTVCSLRVKANLTQEELAERSDLSRKFIQDIERGLKCASVISLAKIRSGLQCDWDDLLKKLR